MIIDLQRFLAHERPFWVELERMLDLIESQPNNKLSLAHLDRFHLLYERAAADLAKISTFAAEPETSRYLESLVARAYGEIHETRERGARFSPLTSLFQTFPRTFRLHIRAFWLSLAVTLAGCVFGAFALALDPEAKPILMPPPHSEMTPSQRVAQEEHATHDRLAGRKSRFSAFLMTHNTRVSILTLALGMTWGIGSIIELFYNGVILGAISLDYIRDGQTKFLLGWLLPHGVIEIPSILIAGQAGLLLAQALIGRGSRAPMRDRLRAITPDLTTLIFGVAVLLIWAGTVESFLSQYHEPAISYSSKIIFGLVEFALLCLFLFRSGAKGEPARAPASGRVAPRPTDPH